MPRLRNAAGVTINVSDEQAARLGSGWQTAKRSRKRADKSDKSGSKSDTPTRADETGSTDAGSA